MAIKSGLTKYKSISKPSYGGGGSSRLSTYITSLTKKQNAAEDAILDNQYSEGIITPENYLNALKTRLGRDYLTPLQIVNLQDKMVQVGEKVNDASVDRQYKAGEITTSQVYSYEKTKLDKMTATDSPTYNSQSIKVQQLKDKAEKETRAEYRLTENVRISKLPEDSSANLWAKAKLYENLQNQATLDGDTQQAMAYEATKNNYTSSAKQGDINDEYTNLREETANFVPQGLDNPSSEGGQGLFGQGEVGGGGGTTPAPTTAASSGGAGVGAVSSGYTNPAMNNAYERLDAINKNLQGTYGDYQKQNNFITKLRQIYNKAEGDQKTSFGIQLQNAENTLKEIESNISLGTERFQEQKIKIQELQAAAEFSNFRSKVAQDEDEIRLLEKQNEDKLQRGQIDKNIYLTTKFKIETDKATVFDTASKGYYQRGDDNRGGDYRTNLIGVRAQIDDTVEKANNIDYWELYKAPGKKIELKDFTRDKINDTFNMDYINNGGAYQEIFFPGKKDKKTGLPISGSMAKELGMLKDEAVILTDERDKNGNPIYKQVNFVTFTDDKGRAVNVKPVLSDQVNILEKKGIIEKTKGVTNFTVNDSQLQLNPDGSVNFSIPHPPPPAPGTADQIYKNVTGTLDYMGKNMPKVGTTEVDSRGYKLWMPLKGGFTPGFLDTPIKKGQELLKNVGQGISDFLGGKYGVTERINGRDIYMPFKKKPEGQTSTNANPLDFVTQAIQKIFPTVQASEINKNVPVIQGKNTQGQVDKVLSSLPENERNTAALITKALKEQGILNPNTLAYALATAKAESGFVPKDEILADPNRQPELYRLQQNYSGGWNYHGRGLIQLTHDYNYKAMGDKLGVDLLNNPELANDPQIAARIFALFFKDKGVADLARSGNFEGARTKINPDNRAVEIANIANQYLGNQPLMKSLISSVNAQEKKPVGKTSLKLRYEDPKPKNFFQNIKDFFIKPVEAGTVSKVTTPKPFVPQISTNQGTKTFTPTQSTNTQQNKSNQQTNQSTQQKSTPNPTPVPTPTYQTKVPTPVYQTKAPAPQYQTPAPRYTPAPPPKQNIIQKSISSVSNFINKYKWW